HGYIDTVVVHGTWGSWGSSGVDSASNQFAAMPSLHIGWSVWCALAVIHLAPRLWVKVLGALYPCVTLLVIVATANHFVHDAVRGDREVEQCDRRDEVGLHRTAEHPEHERRPHRRSRRRESQQESG